MDIKKNRCFSGPPSHLGFCASDLATAKPLFFWYALARTFLQAPYPMWADAEDLWAPGLGPSTEDRAFASAMAIAYGENECVETSFPAHNPVNGLRELHASNPMTPLTQFSFWSTTLRPYVQRHGSAQSLDLVGAVDALFEAWRRRFARRSEIGIDYEAPYHIENRPLTISAGLPQIRDYAQHQQDVELLGHFEAIRIALKAARAAFDEFLRSSDQVGYFYGDAARNDAESLPDVLPNVPERTAFEKALARRLALAAHIVDRSSADPALGRTKLVKIFYLADQRAALDLRMSWSREAAGPLDARAVYHDRVGFEALAARGNLFTVEEVRGKIRYRSSSALAGSRRWIHRHLGDHIEEIDQIVSLLGPLDTDQCEIVATLYACWNDLLLRGGQAIEDDTIIADFRESWHASKARFSRSRLVKALDWMRENSLTPVGRGTRTRVRTSP